MDDRDPRAGPALRQSARQQLRVVRHILDKQNILGPLHESHLAFMVVVAALCAEPGPPSFCSACADVYRSAAKLPSSRTAATNVRDSLSVLATKQWREAIFLKKRSQSCRKICDAMRARAERTGCTLAKCTRRTP